MLRNITETRQSHVQFGMRLKCSQVRRGQTSATLHKWREANSIGSTSTTVRSVYGVVQCGNHVEGLWSNPEPFVEILRWQGFADLIPDEGRIGKQASVLNSNIILENTVENQLLVWDWLQMALKKPETFCASSIQDQTAWNVLVLNRSLPLVNVCPYHTAQLRKLKSLGYLLARIANGLYTVL